jgi:hypothetical protein
MESKIEIFIMLDKFCRPATILAANTSSLSVTEIASATYRAKQCVGMHFFNPVHKMKAARNRARAPKPMTTRWPPWSKSASACARKYKSPNKT